MCRISAWCVYALEIQHHFSFRSTIAETKRLGLDLCVCLQTNKKVIMPAPAHTHPTGNSGILGRVVGLPLKILNLAKAYIGYGVRD